MTTKSCTRCRTMQPIDAFSVRKSGRPQSWCRPCLAEHNRERRRKAPTPTYPNDHAERHALDGEWASDCQTARTLLEMCWVEVPSWVALTDGGMAPC